MHVTGSSDPFCQVYIGDECKFVTQVKKKTLAPLWDETVTLELPKDDETLEIVSFLFVSFRKYEATIDIRLCRSQVTLSLEKN